MTIQAGVGVSTNRNPKVAGKEAARKALDVAKLERPDFVFMFATVGYPQKDILNAVRQATAQAPLCGCSGEGIIAQDIADESNFSVAVMVLKSDDLKFFHGLSAGLKADSEAVGRDMGRSLQHHIGDDTKALFVFGDGLTINFDSFQRGVGETISKGVNLPMFGGVSADNGAFRQTYQYCDDRVASDSVVWAMLRGKTSILSCVNHGCVPIGGKRTVTRAKGSVIYEIDRQPALEVLKEYLLPEEINNWGKAVLSLCLGFKTPAYLEGYDEYMIRFIPAKDDAGRSISIQTEIREGCDIWMTRRDADRMAEGLKRAADDIVSRSGSQKPKLIFQFDCCGRGKVILQESVKHKFLNDIQQKIGPKTPWIGFYTLGEIGPVGNYNCFHNYSIVLAALY
jgi:hypothetical protein